jgi:hypothetical protein
MAKVASKTSVRSPRNIETRKKKARRVIPRSPLSRSQGNTSAARTKSKKASLLRQGRASAV